VKCLNSSIVRLKRFKFCRVYSAIRLNSSIVRLKQLTEKEQALGIGSLNSSIVRLKLVRLIHRRVSYRSQF